MGSAVGFGFAPAFLRFAFAMVKKVMIRDAG